jgi:hypothetical protein
MIPLSSVLAPGPSRATKYRGVMTPLHAIYQPPAVIVMVAKAATGRPKDTTTTVGQWIDVKPGEVRETIPPVNEPSRVSYCLPEWLDKDEFRIRCVDSNGQLVIITGPFYTEPKRK